MKMGADLRVLVQQTENSATSNQGLNWDIWVADLCENVDWQVHQAIELAGHAAAFSFRPPLLRGFGTGRFIIVVLSLFNSLLLLSRRLRDCIFERGALSSVTILFLTGYETVMAHTFFHWRLAATAIISELGIVDSFTACLDHRRPTNVRG